MHCICIVAIACSCASHMATLCVCAEGRANGFQIGACCPRACRPRARESNQALFFGAKHTEKPVAKRADQSSPSTIILVPSLLHI
ncbi:hypothetical protein PR003_g18903 [Phytophthora rubi]|uniref:Secreted protein n=1 Tax=Phytophthora rubi TaxID=129364 RepID=A0A6A3K2M9_9STRA|nr:hypothetical protein PR002_g18341 [Phytophthora rubi]KAE9036515.1 hypothetical protein PR001_g8803 [Phytophthora rubi]KAE9315759.1 hypothetical protein PR003_g18903 [Phytophthora rubi]